MRYASSGARRQQSFSATVDLHEHKVNPGGNVLDVSSFPNSTAAGWSADAAERFAEIYRREYPAVLGFVTRRAQPSRAEDIVHETFTTAWQRFGDLPKADDEVKPWLFAVARNHLLHDQRSHTRRGALWVRLALNTDTHDDDHADSVNMSVDLAAAWNMLSAGHQEVLALAGWEGLTSTEAGQVLGISATAYRLRLRKARAALKAALNLKWIQQPTPDLTPAPFASR